jgi:hypothetical protein
MEASAKQMFVYVYNGLWCKCKTVYNKVKGWHSLLAALA